MLKMSLSAWSKPSRSVFRRVIALGMAVSFLFPAMSWAFQVQAYDTDPGAAAVPEVTPNIGKVVSASRGTNGSTLYLVQDLHCNYEVQTNIRRILGELKKKNPDMKMVAVEGATGIIPTRALAGLPNSPAKRAVAAYFMREGKLTGADVLAICDQPQIELFGAENRGLYSQSLALIQDFVTESNRGLVLELMDRIKFLQGRVFNGKLLAFEKRREAMLMGRLDIRDYHKGLIQAAMGMNIPVGMEKFNGSGGGWDLYERTLLDRVLETKIRTNLLKTKEEKQLSEYGLYVEAAERILSVSASQAEVDAFKAASAQLSLAAIEKNLQAQFRKMDYYAGVDSAFGEEVSALEKSMAKGLQFYQLAKARNQALFEKATARLRTRGEQKAALVAGGFHTEGIAQLARAQGYTVVVVRPLQVNPDTTNNYFLRLRYPDQPTELERLLTSLRQPAGAAIAVPNSINPEFNQNFSQAVDESAQALTTLKEGRIITAANTVMDSRTDGIVRLRLSRGTVFYLTFVKGELFVDRSLDKVIQFRQTAGINSLPANNTVRGILRLPVVRIAGMAILGVVGIGLTFVFLQVAAGVVVAPLVIAGLAGLALVGLWALANAPLLSWKTVVTRKNAVFSSVLAGSAMFSMALGSLMSDALAKLSNTTADPAHLASRTVKFVWHMLAGVGLAPQHHDPVLAGELALQIFSVAANTMVGAVLSTPIRMAISATDQLLFRNRKSSVNVLGMSFREALARAFKKKVANLESEEFGTEYEENQISRPVQGAVPILSEEDRDEMMEILSNMGLSEFERATPVDFSFKSIKIDSDSKYLLPAPLECETSFEPVGNMAQLIHRIIVMDFLFVDEKGKNLNLSEMPQNAIEGILNPLIPTSYDHVYSRQEIVELFQHAGRNGPVFLSYYDAAVEKWRGRKIPLTLQTMKRFIKQGILHESNHGVVLHLAEPDLVRQGQNETTEHFNESLENFKKISVKAYLALLTAHLSQSADWQTSVVFIKNLFKAMVSTKKEAAKKSTWDPKEKANYFIAHLITEMFNDRFEIFELETNAKMEAYQKALRVDYAIPVRMLRGLEKELATATEQQATTKVNAFQSKYALTDDALATLRKELKEAENNVAVYVAVFGDPALSTSEREFYNLFLDHLLNFEKGKTISFFTQEHTRGLLFQILPTSVYAKGGLSAEDIMQQIVSAGIEGPAGLAVVAAGETVREASGAFNGTVASVGDEATEAVKFQPQSKAKENQAERKVEPLVSVPTLDLGIEDVENAPSVFESQPALGNSHLGAPQIKVAKPLNPDIDEVIEGKSATEPLFLDLAIEDTTPEESAPEQTSNLRLAERQSVQQQKIEASVSLSSENNRGQEQAADEVVIGAGKISADGPMIFSAPQQINAPVDQPVTLQQINAANQTLAPQRAAQFLPGLFGLWQDTPGPQPGPPPHLPGKPVYFISNDAALIASLADLVSGEPLPGITPEEWSAFRKSLQVQIIDPAQGVQGTGAGSAATAAATFAAAELGKMNYDASLKKISTITPAGIPAAGTVNGLVVMTPSASGNVSLTNGLLTSPGSGQTALNTSLVPGAQNLVSNEAGRPVEEAQNAGTSLAKESTQNAQNRLNGQLGTTAVVFANGQIGVPLQVVGIPMKMLLSDATRPESFAESIARSNELKRTLVDASAYSNMLLLTRDQINAAEVRDVLGNFDEASNLVQVLVKGSSDADGLLRTQLGAQGYQRLQSLRRLIDSQAAQFKSAFAAGAKGVSVALDTVSADAMDKLSKALANGKLAIVGSSASSAQLKMSAFLGLSGIAESSGLVAEHVGDMSLLAQQVAPGSPLTDQVDQIADIAFGHAANSSASALANVAGKPVTADQVAAFKDQTGALDEVAYFSTSRSHGTALEERSRLTSDPGILDIVVYNRGTRETGRLFNGAKNVPQLVETPFLASKSWAKTFSITALLLAGMSLVGRFLGNLNTTLESKGFKGQRLPIIPIVTHPSFIRALVLMRRIVFGNYGDRDIQDPLMRQQLADLRKMEADGKNLLGLETKGTETPASLRYTLPLLLKLKAWLSGGVAALILKLLKVNLDTLNPELLMLVNAFLSMEGVTWYFAKQTYMLKQVEARKGVMDAGLWSALMRADDERKKAVQESVAKLQVLRNNPNRTAQEEKAMERLKVDVRDLKFANRFRDKIALMDKDNSPRLVKSLLTTLIGQLSREDASSSYKDSILQIISLIDPDNQITVQMTEVREGQVRNVFINLPQILRNSPEHLEMFLRHYPLYDDKGHPITAPERNRIVSALQAA